MASLDYNRRAYATPLTGNSTFNQGSEDHSPLYTTYQDNQQELAYGPSGGSGLGRRPLAWGAGAPSAQRYPQQSGAVVTERYPEAAVWSGANPGAGSLANNYNCAAADDKDGAYTHMQQRAPGATAAQPAVVLGREIAGYKSVVTKNPVSPSGYSIAAPQQQQQQQPSASAVPAGGQRATLAPAGATHQQFQQTAVPAAGDACNPSARSAAAAAAALAALGNNRARSPQGLVRPAVSSTGPGSAGRAYPGASDYSSYSSGISDSYSAMGDQSVGYPQPPTTADSPSMLQWKLPARAPVSAGGSSAAGHVPVAGRRAAVSAGASTYAPRSVPSSSTDGTPGSYVPSSALGLRPPSQQRSEGLSKLKQLASARLVSRIATPPTGELAAVALAAPAADISAAQGRSASSSGRSAAVGGRAGQAAAQTQQRQWPKQQLQQVQAAESYDPSSYTDAQYQPSIAGRRASGSRQTAANGNKAAPQSQQQEQQQTRYTPSVSKVIGSYDGSSAAPADYESIKQPAAGEACHECRSCGRRFVAAAFEKHVRICDKVFGQKRKAFNMQSQRLQDTEAAKFVGKGNSRAAASWGSQQQQQGAAGKALSSKQLDSRPAMSAAAAKKSKWQQQSEQLRKAMRAAQGGSGGSSAGPGSGRGWGCPVGAAAAVEEQDDRVPCPHCGRKFAELVAERHIPKCSEIIAKPKKLNAGGGKGAYMRNNSRQGR